MFSVNFHFTSGSQQHDDDAVNKYLFYFNCSDFGDVIADSAPIFASTTPVQPLNKPIQPFANKKIPPPPISRVVPPRPNPPSASPISTPPQAPATPPTTLNETFGTSSIFPPPVVQSIPTPIPTTQTPVTQAPPAPTPATAKPKAKKPAPRPNAGNAGNAGVAKPAPAQGAKPAPSHAERAALARDLAGRTPAQLLTQIAQLQQHNATLQSQLVYHSAVDAIYGETGFNQLRNLISEFSEEESLALKT